MWLVVIEHIHINREREIDREREITLKHKKINETHYLSKDILSTEWWIQFRLF